MTTPALTTPQPNFAHLIHMTDERGTFEHALFAEPRPEHGYCTDEWQRVLLVTCREPNATPAVRQLMEVSLRFLDDAIDASGRCRNRMNRLGRWEDTPELDDCWGRCIGGLGAAISQSDDEGVRRRATLLFDRASIQRAAWPRAMAFAALGAADVLAAKPDHGGAHGLLVAAADMIGRAGSGVEWAWPEPRLTYANAVLPEAMIAAGSILDRPGLLDRGLELLEWLRVRETCDGHLSVTPAGGAGPSEHAPRFDQQPIEVAAMADACARAARVDGDRQWSEGVHAAAAWFLGDNDSQIVMWDEATGAGFDGLEVGGANLNRGTESTLALLSILQHARQFVAVGS